MVNRVKSMEELEKEICALREELDNVQNILNRAVRPMFIEWVKAKDAETVETMDGDVAFV